MGGDGVNAFENIFYAYGRRVTVVCVCDEFYVCVCGGICGDVCADV